MVVDRHRQDALRPVLADHIIVQHIADFLRGRHAAILLADETALGLLPDDVVAQFHAFVADEHGRPRDQLRSEEHTSELQSLMRTPYAVLCLKKKNNTNLL